MTPWTWVVLVAVVVASLYLDEWLLAGSAVAVTLVMAFMGRVQNGARRGPGAEFELISEFDEPGHDASEGEDDGDDGDD